MSLFAITGGAGFIGSHLADALLAGGHQIRILDDFSTGKRGNIDPRCTVIRGDVADPAAVHAALAGADGCFHLAAVASVMRGNEAWFDTHRTNLAGTVAVLQTARDHGRIPVVFASSAAVYGDVGDRVADEQIPPCPLTAYGADKLGSELHARVAARVHGVPTLGLRFFNVYGPRQDPASPYSGVISIFAGLLARGGRLTVHGDGRQTRDFVYVGDVVEHLLAAMRYLRAGGTPTVLNVCTGRETQILGLARLLGRAVGRDPDIAPGPARAGDIRHSVGDPSTTIATLGVRALTDLADGLQRTLSHVAAEVEVAAA